MEMALAFLSAVDPEAFEIAFMVVEGDPASSSESAAEEEALADWEGEEASPVCRKCGSLTGIFLDRGLQWQHFRGDGITSGVQQIYDPGHEPVVSWILPDEDLAEV